MLIYDQFMRTIKSIYYERFDLTTPSSAQKSKFEFEKLNLQI